MYDKVMNFLKIFIENARKFVLILWRKFDILLLDNYTKTQFDLENKFYDIS